jgi:hypothetical protein
VRFRKAAKAPQGRYGRMNQLAIDENGANPTISGRIEIQRNGTSIKAYPELLVAGHSGMFMNKMCGAVCGRRRSILLAESPRESDEPDLVVT